MLSKPRIIEKNRRLEIGKLDAARRTRAQGKWY